MRFFLAVILLSTVCSAQDKVEQFAHAIARTEGYYVHGSLPSRCHNAGDLKVMSNHSKYPGQIGVCKGGHVRFVNDAAGYAALLQQDRQDSCRGVPMVQTRHDPTADGKVLCTELTSLGEEPSA